MRLDKIVIDNFRCFEHLEMDFHSNLTVIVAENGQGKSTVLDAIRIGLWPFVSSFDLARSSFNDPNNAIRIDDVRLVRLSSGDMARQLPARIALLGDYGEGQASVWERYREKETPLTKTKDDGGTVTMKQWTTELQTRIRDPEQPIVSLPVLGYYGTGRLGAQKKLTEFTRGKDDTEGADFYIRTFAYLNCLDPSSTYKHFKEWFIWASFVYFEQLMNHLEGKALEEVVHRAEAPVLAVRHAIDCFLQPTTGWHSLEYSHSHEKSLVLRHPQLGTMKVEMLSDGIRSVLAMIGDIAYRCIRLNPHLGGEAPKNTEGVVLIDEIDMHLHPRWQQVVIGQLQEAFPKIQFIVTTHSPQVLTTVKAQCIRGLKYIDGKVVVKNDYQFSEGAEAQLALEDILGVSPRPQDLDVVKQLNAYLDLVAKDHWDTPAAAELRKKLDEWGRGHESALLKADMDIRMRQYRRKQGSA